MISNNNPPDIDPVNNDTLAGTLNYVFKKSMQQINHMLPAQVIAYDRTANRAQVQLLINMVTTTGVQVPRAQLSSVPVLVLGNRRVFLSFDLTAGDLGWIIANDRDISLFLQSHANTGPNSARMFSFSDGLFIPDTMYGYIVDPSDTSSTVLSTLDSKNKISISDNGITITSILASDVGIYSTYSLIPTGMTITSSNGAERTILSISPTGSQLTGNLSISGNITATNIDMTGTLNLTGPMNMTGDLAVDGNITATGNITPHV